MYNLCVFILPVRVPVHKKANYFGIHSNFLLSLIIMFTLSVTPIKLCCVILSSTDKKKGNVLA